MSKGKEFFVGFDLGGTKMMATVFDASLNKLCSARKKTKAQEGIKKGLTRMEDLINECLNGAGISKTELAGIGIGCPGVLDIKRGVLRESANLGWEDVNLKAYFSEKFSCYVCTINDVDAGLYGEYKKGAGINYSRIVGVFPGTGIGGACIIDGIIMMGKKTSCMEIGHICVAPETGFLCGCGNTGCLETVASRLAIASQAAAAAYRGQAPALLARCGTDIAAIKSKDIAYSISAGDKCVEQIVRNAARWLGCGISIAVDLLLPDIVIIGGGLVDVLPKFYLDEIYDSALKHVMPSFRKILRILPAQLGDDAVTIGAAGWVKQLLQSNNELN